MSLKAIHRILDIIDKHFDDSTPIDFFLIQLWSIIKFL